MTPRATSPDPTPVFNALDAYMAGTSFTSSNASVSYDGSGTSHTMNSQDGKGNSTNYTVRTATVRVNVTPNTASLGPGGTQQFAATATNPDGSAYAGATFTWSLATPAHGTVSTTGLYTAPATITAAATDLLTCTLTGQNSWASLNISLHT